MLIWLLLRMAIAWERPRSLPFSVTCSPGIALKVMGFPSVPVARTRTNSLYVPLAISTVSPAFASAAAREMERNAPLRSKPSFASFPSGATY